MEQDSKLTLGELLNYDLDTYYSEDELRWIKATFSDPFAVRIIRKVFLPTVHDASLPIEELGADLWLSGRDWAQIPQEEAKSLIVARQEAIKFIVHCLMKLKTLANLKEETPTAAAERRHKDSAK